MYNEYQIYKKAKTRPVAAAAGAVLAPTGPDIEGPFYKAGAPFNEKLAEEPTLQLSGRVLDTDGNPIRQAVLDFWQADAAGQYDNEGMKFRGKVRSDDNGYYTVLTIVPGDYQIGPNEFRCAHIHVKLTAAQFKPLTTQLYFAENQYNGTDHWFDASRVVRQEKPDQAVFDFVLEKA